MEILTRLTHMTTPARRRPRQRTTAAQPQPATRPAPRMTGLREAARTSEVTAIHTTNLVSALHIYAKMIRLRDGNEPAGRAVIACKAEQLELADGCVYDIQPVPGSDADVCVRFVTPSIQRAFTTLHRAGARILEGVTKLDNGCVAFRLADARGNVIEIVGTP